MDILSIILKRIEEAKKFATDSVVSGQNIDDFAKYQRLVGELVGLEKALIIIDNTLTESDVDEDL